MTAATDPATCADCRVVKVCDAWVPGGQWKHAKGRHPCRVAPEEIIDTDARQQDRIRQYQHEHGIRPVNPDGSVFEILQNLTAVKED